jgi:tellurite resistance protein
MPAVLRDTNLLGRAAIAVQEAGVKVRTAVRELKRREDEAASFMQRFILKEIEQRTRTRDTAYWDAAFPGLTAAERASRRIDRMLVRSTVAGVAAAAAASAAELMSMWTQGAAALAAAPLGIVTVGAEMLYTTALQIDLAFDLASIYGVPFAADDVGEISTMLALALGVDLVKEPTRHDKPVAIAGETKPWRVMRQMQREDFSRRVGRELIQQSVLRHLVPVVSVVVSAAWNQVVLRRFAHEVHAAVKQRRSIVEACRAVQLGDVQSARVILNGAWLLATADGEIEHQEAVALATLIDSLPLPQRISVQEESFPDAGDEEPWFDALPQLEPAARGVLLKVLAYVAIADGALSTPERRFFRRLSKQLDTAIDIKAIEGLAARLHATDDVSEASAPLAIAPALA